MCDVCMSVHKYVSAFVSVRHVWPCVLDSDVCECVVNEFL